MSLKTVKQVYSRYPCIETQDKNILLKLPKDLFIWSTGAIMTGCSF